MNEAIEVVIVKAQAGEQLSAASLPVIPTPQGNAGLYQPRV